MRRSNWLRIVGLAGPFVVGLVAAPNPLDPVDVSEPRTQARAEEAGAVSVQTRTGAASYTYRFKLPPARGVGAELSLTYSSSGSIRGGIAQGWELSPMAVIRRDVGRETATSGPEYTAHFGASIEELVRAPSDVVSSGATAYRARVDRGEFTRFEKYASSWIAYTSDGKRYIFGGAPDTVVGEEFYLWKVIDRWGNQAIREYSVVRWRRDPSGLGSPMDPVDLVLKAIEYSSNDTAPVIDSHARVELTWGDLAGTGCIGSYGLRLPVGASLDHRSGSRHIRGTMRLTQVRSLVRESGRGSSWREARRWNLGYDPASESCDRATSPRRHLTSIAETGTVGSTVTAGPTVRFTYNPEPDARVSSDGGSFLPTFSGHPKSTARGQRTRALTITAGGTADPQTAIVKPVYSELMDIDGDGLLDLVRTEVGHTVYDNAGDYLILAKDKKEYAGESNPLAEVARAEYFYDGAQAGVGTCANAFCKGALTKRRVYRQLGPSVNEVVCSDPSVCVDYGAWFDPHTGNKIREVRPAVMMNPRAQADLANAPGTRYSYGGPYSLFLTLMINELGHQVGMAYELGTGVKTAVAGPNFKDANCNPSCTRVWAQSSFLYDGLGRLVSEYAPKDSPAQGYVPRLMKTIVYTDYPAVSSTFRGDVVTVLDATDSKDTPESARRTFIDCLGRTAGVHVLSDAGASLSWDVNTPGVNEAHRVSYDARNRAVASIDPLPTSWGDAASATVTHRFDYDARDRLTTVWAPSESNPVLSVRYSPWEKTSIDADGSLQHQLFDGFGQVRSVEESGAQSQDQAHTVYDYDGAGRLWTIQDDDGHVTTITHDAQGNRLQITRPGGRNWNYRYTADGEIASKQDPDFRWTSYVYDELGRTKTETVDNAGPLPSGLDTANSRISRDRIEPKMARRWDAK